MLFIEYINKLRNTFASQEYLQLIPNLTYSYTTAIIKEISIAVSDRDSEFLESLLLVAIRDGLSKEYTLTLCGLLTEDWHYSQEDIALMLEEIQDERSVECLYDASINVPDYDDGRSLAKKCIWALGAINTPAAIEKLNALSHSQDSIIRESSIEQLKNIK